MIDNSRREMADFDIEPPKIDDIEAYAQNVYKFSLAGIRAIRREVEKSQEDAGKLRGSKK